MNEYEHISQSPCLPNASLFHHRDGLSKIKRMELHQSQGNPNHLPEDSVIRLNNNRCHVNI